MQFQEYLLWKLFIIRTDNNLLTYIMTAPYLDATQYCWVESLVRFTFSTEYQKGWNIAAMDALSWVTSKLNAETVKSILDGVTMGMTERVDAHVPAVLRLMKRYISKSGKLLSWLEPAMHVWTYIWLDWLTTQQEDPILKTMIKWISNWKVLDLKYMLGDDANTEEGKAILQEQKKLTLYQGALYHCHTPAGKLEEVLQFVVPMAHQVTLMNGYQWDAGHQGQQQTLYLLHDQFWWPRMPMQMQKAISSCEWCITHEGTCAKVPMQPIIVTAPLELLQMDFTSIEMTVELDQPLNMVNVLVFYTHFTKHIMAYVTPYQTEKTVAKILWQGHTSQSLEHQPSSWVTKEPNLRATS